MADVALSDDLRQAVARGRRDLAWLLAPVDALEARTLAAEAAARGAAFREGEAANEAAVLRARLATADALAAQRDELIATLLDRKELDARAAVHADRLLAEARAQVDALTAERDRYREVATTSDSDAEREAIAWADRVVALEARVLALRTMLATSRREHDDLRDAEYSSGKPGPVEEYLAEIDADLAALPTETS